MAACLLSTTTSFAQSTAEACVDAHVKVQVHRRAGKIIEAQRSARTCGQEHCPHMVRGECLQLLLEIERELPSVMFRVVGPDGNDLVDVTVLMDGEVVTQRLEGKPFDADPGAHPVRFLIPGQDAVERTVVVRHAVKNQLVEVRIEPEPEPPEPIPAAPPPPQPPPPPEPPGISPAAWILGGTGVASLIAFGALSGVGWSERGDLDACSPQCSDDEVDSVRGKLLAADVLLGVGLVSLASAATVFLLTPDPNDPATTVGVALAPTPAGGFGQLRARF